MAERRRGAQRGGRGEADAEAGAGFLEGQPLDQELKVGWQPTLSSISARTPRQPRQTVLLMLPCPALHGSKGDPVLLSDPSEWHTLLGVRPQELKTLTDGSAGLLRELCQGGDSQPSWDLLAFLSLS